MENPLLDVLLVYPGTRMLEEYPEKADTIKAFWRAIVISHMNNADTNGIVWYERLGAKLYNTLVRRLDHHGYITSHSLTGRKWASVQLNDSKLEELYTKSAVQEAKRIYKYNKYLQTFSASVEDTMVKQNHQLRKTGISRPGFRDAGNTQFGYDMAALDKYAKAVKLNLTKSMDKIKQHYPNMRSDSDTYDQVSVGVYDYHKSNPLDLFTTGTNINDARGRAISSCLRRIANPISNKDFRAALVIPQ